MIAIARSSAPNGIMLRGFGSGLALLIRWAGSSSEGDEKRKTILA
jgi:hypothetical protein